jgi:hypothetical protein
MAKLNAQGKSDPPPAPARVPSSKDDLKATLALSTDDLNALLDEVKKLQTEGAEHPSEFPDEPTDPSPISEILARKDPAPPHSAPPPNRLINKISRSR